MEEKTEANEVEAFVAPTEKTLGFTLFGDPVVVRKLVVIQAERVFGLIGDTVGDLASGDAETAEALDQVAEGVMTGAGLKRLVNLMTSLLGDKMRMLACEILINLPNAKEWGYIGPDSKSVPAPKAASMRDDIAWNLESNQAIEVVGTWLEIEAVGDLLKNALGLLSGPLGSLMESEGTEEPETTSD